MCRNIKTLSNFEPPVAGEEINAASLQYVRKLTGFNKPSKINEHLGAVARLARNHSSAQGQGGRGGGQGESTLGPTIRRVPQR
jgi:hypothetical protein